MTASNRARRVAKAPTCLLCGASGNPVDAGNNTTIYVHFDPNENRDRREGLPTCAVRVFDVNGVCRDDEYEIEDGQLYRIDPEPTLTLVPEVASALAGTTSPTTGDIILPASWQKGPWVRTDVATNEIFDTYGVPRLGGISGLRGWSSISTFQRCRYLWMLQYRGGKGRNREGTESPALAVGSLIHTFLALYYQYIIDPHYPLTVTALREQLFERQVDPEHITEAWRIFTAYVDHYEGEPLQPLAVEYLLADPETGHSCRFDLIARITEATPQLMEGTYLVDHKSSSRNEGDTWQNDGELIGQIDLWKRMKLDKRFGELRGVIVNQLVKTLVPKFLRYTLSPQNWQIKDHRRTLAIFTAEIEHAKATGVFPRSRAACLGRYGKCAHYDHCANVHDDPVEATDA